MGIIKTGLFVDGVEITSEHIRWIETGSACCRVGSDSWLPCGFVTSIVGVY